MCFQDTDQTPLKARDKDVACTEADKTQPASGPTPSAHGRVAASSSSSLTDLCLPMLQPSPVTASSTSTSSSQSSSASVKPSSSSNLPDSTLTPATTVSKPSALSTSATQLSGDRLLSQESSLSNPLVKQKSDDVKLSGVTSTDLKQKCTGKDIDSHNATETSLAKSSTCYKSSHPIGSRKVTENVITYEEPMFQYVANTLFENQKNQMMGKRKLEESKTSSSPDIKKAKTSPISLPLSSPVSKSPPLLPKSSGKKKCSIENIIERIRTEKTVSRSVSGDCVSVVRSLDLDNVGNDQKGTNITQQGARSIADNTERPSTSILPHEIKIEIGTSAIDNDSEPLNLTVKADKREKAEVSEAEVVEKGSVKKVQNMTDNLASVFKDSAEKVDKNDMNVNQITEENKTESSDKVTNSVNNKEKNVHKKSKAKVNHLNGDEKNQEKTTKEKISLKNEKTEKKSNDTSSKKLLKTTKTQDECGNKSELISSNKTKDKSPVKVKDTVPTKLKHKTPAKVKEKAKESSNNVKTPKLKKEIGEDKETTCKDSKSASVKKSPKKVPSPDTKKTGKVTKQRKNKMPIACRRVKREASLNAAAFVNIMCEKQYKSPKLEKRSKSDSDLRTKPVEQTLGGSLSQSVSDISKVEHDTDRDCENVFLESNTVTPKKFYSKSKSCSSAQADTFKVPISPKEKSVTKKKQSVGDDEFESLVQAVIRRSIRETEGKGPRGRPKALTKNTSVESLNKAKRESLFLTKVKKKLDSNVKKEAVEKIKKALKLTVNKANDEKEDKKRKAAQARIARAKELLKTKKRMSGDFAEDKSSSRSSSSDSESSSSDENVDVEADTSTDNDSSHTDSDSKARNKKGALCRAARTNISVESKTVVENAMPSPRWCECCQSTYYPSQPTHSAQVWRIKQLVDKDSSKSPETIQSSSHHFIAAHASSEVRPYASPSHVSMIDSGPYMSQIGTQIGTQIVPHGHIQCSACSCGHSGMFHTSCQNCSCGVLPCQRYGNTYSVTFPHSHGSYIHCGKSKKTLHWINKYGIVLNVAC